MRRIHVIGVAVLCMLVLFAGCTSSESAANNGADTDGDGVPDAEDACPEYQADTESGCPDQEPTGGL